MSGHRYHDLVLFRDGDNNCAYKDFFHFVLTSYGKTKPDIIRNIEKSMIVLFINVFLMKTCITGYNETNINRLLTNYSPDASKAVDDTILYSSVKEFNNLYWAKSHLKNWRLYSRFRAILMHRVPSNIVSMADLVITVIFMQASGMIQINPIYNTNILRGNPFFVKDVICTYWFMNGLKYKSIFEYKFHQEYFFEKRKKQYIKDCSEKSVIAKQR